jgi:hypothetical protein
MKVLPKSWVLALLAAFLAVVQALGVGAAQVELLPELPSFVPDQVQRLSFYTPVSKIEIARVDPEHWRITAPLDFPADEAQVRSMLRQVSGGVPMDTLVDQGNHEDYGVDDQHGLLVEVWTDGPTPVSSFWIGNSVAGTTSFVRLPGNEAVYRADVGSRKRWDRPAADWRDRMALDLDRKDVLAVDITRRGERLSLRRGPATDGPGGKAVPGHWTLEGAPFATDDDAAEALVRTIAHVRAGEIHNADYEAGFAAPLAEARLGMADGSSHRVVLGSREDQDAAFIRVDERPEVFRVAGTVRRAMLQDAATLRDRQMLSFAREQLDSVSLAEGGLTVVLGVEDEGRRFVIRQPANMDADQKQCLFTVNTLANLRAAALGSSEQFTPSGDRLVVAFRDGKKVTLDLGRPVAAEQAPMVPVRVSDRDGVYLMRASSLDELRKAFGRG